MRKVLAMQNPHWSNKDYKQISKRFILNRLLKKLSLKKIQVLLGIRRERNFLRKSR